MAYDLPTAWKMDGLELSIEQKLNYLAAHVAALEAAGPGSTVSASASSIAEPRYKIGEITIDGSKKTFYGKEQISEFDLTPLPDSFMTYAATGIQQVVLLSTFGQVVLIDTDTMTMSDDDKEAFLDMGRSLVNILEAGRIPMAVIPGTGGLSTNFLPEFMESYASDYYKRDVTYPFANSFVAGTWTVGSIIISTISNQDYDDVGQVTMTFSGVTYTLGN